MQRVNSPKTFIFSSVLAAALMLAWALPASAQVDFLFNEQQYVSNHHNQFVQTFAAGDVAPGSFTECGPVANNGTDDDCFDPGDILPGIEFVVNPSATEILFLGGINYFGEGSPRNSLSTDGGGSTMDIFFASAENAVGLRPGCFIEGPFCSETLIIRVFDAGDNLIGSTMVDVTSLFDDFLGIESSVGIARINISGPADATQAVDEVRFGEFTANIPTLSEWGMIAAAAGLGLVGVLFAIGRKRTASGT
jgi:hypothetical protein